MAYTTQALIEAELGEQFDANSTPTSTNITNWISEVEAEIDLVCGTSFTTKTATDEYYDYPENSDYFIVNNKPMIAVTSLYYNSNSLGSTANWVLLTEGYENDFLVYEKQGKVALHSKTYNIPSGNKNIKITYTYGKSAVPATIQKLATLMVCERIINQKMLQIRKKSPLDMTIGELSIRHSRDAIISQKEMFMKEAERLYGNHGKLKTYLDMTNG